MDEQNLLSRLRHGNEQALAAAITQYSAYVVTVIHNRSRGLLLAGKMRTSWPRASFSRSGSPAGR